VGNIAEVIDDSLAGCSDTSSTSAQPVLNPHDEVAQGFQIAPSSAARIQFGCERTS